MKRLILLALILAPLSLFAQKVGVVNQGEIIQAMPEYTAAQTELQNTSKQYEDELKRMQEELTKKAEAFDKEQATLPEAIKTRRQNELQEMYQKIQQYAQDA
ncbi:MAG: OmpH family outer membrane protein, partial [Bacteroidales bacterium]|nr:OmpH family outer membrane protein [Bacteroidales bacterium]